MTAREAEKGRHGTDLGTSAGPSPAHAPRAGTSKARRVWRRIAQLGLTILVTWIIIAQVGVTLDEALTPRAAVPELRLGWVGLSIALLLVCFAVTARYWGWMVAELGGRDPGPLVSIRIVLTANLGRYLPGKVWQMAGLAVLSSRAGLSAPLGAAAGILGQIFHLGGAAIVGGVAITSRGGPGWAEALGIGALGLLLILASIPPLLRWGFRLSFRLAGLDPTSAPRPDLLFGPRWLVLHAAVWVGYGAAFACLVTGLGIEAGPVHLAAAFSAAYLLGYLALFAPAGLGVREGVLIALIRPSIGAGAVGVAVLARVWMTLVELVPAGGFALWEIYRRRPKPFSEPGKEIDD